MTMADRIAIMKDGYVQQFGTPDNVYSDPNNLFVAGFIGSPSMNFIPVTFESKGTDLVIVLKNEKGEQFEIPVNSHPDYVAGKEAVLGIRPEAITNTNETREKRAQTVTLDCGIKVMEPTGPDTLVHVDINDTEIVCRVSPESVDKKSKQLTFAIDTSKILFFDAKTKERIGR